MTDFIYICNMKWLRDILKGASLTGALFVFQACYGIPEPPLYEEAGEAPMTFSLVSKSTGEPLEGISIGSNATINRKEGMVMMGVTDAQGKCKVNIPYRRNVEGPFVFFEDPEGRFSDKDTVLLDLRERDILIKMDPVL